MGGALRWYLLGTGSWFVGFGIQSVMFAWLVAMVLQETPQMVGVAQMTLLAPLLLLVLIGGSVADHFGGRRAAIVAHALAGVPPLVLVVFIVHGALSTTVMIGYAIAMGTVSAFLTPARDGLLNEVASGTVQQTVVRATMAQFVGQMVGIVVGSFAGSWGPVPILILQGGIFLIGVAAFARIPHQTGRTRHHTVLAMALGRSIGEAYRVVTRDLAMRTTVLQNVAMSLFFMGAYIVTLPLVVREFYSGGSAELGWTNGAFAVGLVLVVATLSRAPDLARPGRALIGAQAAGAVVLAAAGLGVAFPVFVGLILAWGAFGGIAMSMSRTIVQERAPAEGRGRVMSFYTLSLMGAGPLGALLNGFLAAWIGARETLIVVSIAMFATMVSVALTSELWDLRGEPSAA